MTWTKLGDEYTDQCWKLSDAAFRLHTDGLVWSNRRHLDGVLQKSDIRRWAKTPEAAGELLEQGFWVDEGTVYRIVYHLGWQRTAEQWLRQSEANKANRARSKSRPVKPPKPPPPSNESSDDLSDERDRTGQDRKDAFKATRKLDEVCRYCGTALPAPDRQRGYCHRPACHAEATAELS